MAQVLLCLEDHPQKYKLLRNMVNDLNSDLILVTTCRSQDFMEYLNSSVKIKAIYIKFEMPFGTGSMFIKMFKNHNIPVIITDSDKYERTKLNETFKEVGYDTKLINVVNPSESGWEMDSLIKLGILSEIDNNKSIKDYLLKKYIEL